MVITQDFVFLHFSKTGGSYVTKVLKGLYKLPKKKFYSIKKNEFKNIIKHGSCNDIPEQYRDRPVFCAIRNPLDRLVSMYEFRWWQRVWPQRISAEHMSWVKKRLPSFPDLSFKQFLILENELNDHCFANQDRYANQFGVNTLQLIRKLTPEGQALFDTQTLQNHDAALVLSKFTPDVYLYQDTLQADLEQFLLGCGWSLKIIRQFSQVGKVMPENINNRKGRSLIEYYDLEDFDYVLRKDRLVFEMFPRFKSEVKSLRQQIMAKEQ